MQSKLAKLYVSILAVLTKRVVKLGSSMVDLSVYSLIHGTRDCAQVLTPPLPTLLFGMGFL